MATAGTKTTLLVLVYSSLKLARGLCLCTAKVHIVAYMLYATTNCVSTPITTNNKRA